MRADFYCLIRNLVESFLFNSLFFNVLNLSNEYANFGLAYMSSYLL